MRLQRPIAASRTAVERPGQARNLRESGGLRVSMVWLKSCAAAFLILLCCSVSSGLASEIRILTEEFPPYDFTGDGGEVEGISTEVVREVLAKLAMEVEIEVFPWARAYRLASRNPNTMLFSVVRTQEREALFHWVGVVCEVRSYLFRLKSRTDIAAGKLSDLKEYSIGVVRGWAGQKYLQRNGFTRLQEVAVSGLNIRKLLSGRVDLIEDYEANLVYRMKRLGLDPNVVEKVYFNADISGPLYAVFSKDTADDVIERFRDAFSAVHLSGRYDAIQSKWRDLD